MRLFKRPHKDHPFYSLIVMMDHVMIICGVLLVVLIVLSGCTTTTKIVCPQLAPPPAAIVDALEAASKDPNAAAWTIGLDKQYQKQETCKP